MPEFWEREETLLNVQRRTVLRQSKTLAQQEIKKQSLARDSSNQELVNISTYSQFDGDPSILSLDIKQK